MSWSSITRLSDSEMFPMIPTEDNARTRLLSVSDDEGQERIRIDDLPSLSLRSDRRHLSKPLNEKKSRCAVISVLIAGLLLILVINIGVAMHLKGNDGAFQIFGIPKPTTSSPQCGKKELSTPVIKCDDSFPWQHYQLPDKIHPELYKIFLWPNLTKGTFSGDVDISLHVAVSTNMILLHSKGLNLSDFTISASGAKTTPKTVQYCKELDFVAMILTKELIVGEKATVHIKFSGGMKDTLRGFYMSKYFSKSGEKFQLATTQFEPLDARKSFPCFDEPNFKAKFALSIARPSDYSAISNMPIANTEDFLDGLKLDHFETTLSMSTYLVAFIVSKFDHISKVIHTKNGNVTVSAYAVQDRIDTAEYALNLSCEVIPFYEKLFNIAYPLPKLDVVAIPDFEAGAMENWGLITYRETAVLLDKASSSTFDKEEIAVTIAHELAHQWFGNLVTMKWWNDLWLNEGFASFMEYYALEKLYPGWKFMDSFHRFHTDLAMSTDESEYTHPISVPVNSATTVESLFDAISYSKGASIIMMMVDYLGIKTFITGVNDYLEKFSYQNTENVDLINAVSAEAKEKGKHVPEMLRSWTSQPGFPVVNVSLQGNIVSVSQERYLLHQGDGNTKKCAKHTKDLIWQIPISYVSDLDSSKQWYILDTKSHTIALNNKPNWITMNINRGGYYLVNYDNELLHKIINQLHQNHQVIGAEEREGIISDAIKLAKVGYLKYSDVFNLISYASKETAIGPVKYVGHFVVGIASKLKSEYQLDAYAKIRSYGQRLFKSLYQSHGWPELNQTSSGLSHSQIKLKGLAVSIMCGLENQNCTDEARRRFRMWKDEGLHLDPDYKDIVYNTAIKFGSDEDWDYLWNIYTTDKTIDVHEKKRLLDALCVTRNQKKVFLLLEESLKDDHIRMQDVSSVFRSLRSTQIGGLLTWRFLRNKWTKLLTHFPLGSNDSRRLLSVFNIFVDDVDIAAAEQFLSTNNLTDTLFTKRLLDKAKFNVRWNKMALPQIVNWLNSNNIPAK